jgi:hypothetical protein
MYLTNYELTYKKRIDETTDEVDMLYRMDLVHVFQLDDLFYGKDGDALDDDFNMEPFFKSLTSETDKLYDRFKENTLLIELMENVSKKLKFPIDIHDKHSIFFFLFSFEYFYLFHDCIKDLFLTKTISKINYDNMIRKINTT